MKPITRNLILGIAIPYAVVGAAGFWLALKLISIPGLQIFKVLNVVGITFDLVGVIFLSHFILANPRLQAFAVGPVAENIGLFFVGIPVGMILCVHFGPDGPSRKIVEAISYGATFYLMAPAILYMSHFVAETETLLVKPLESRANMFGAFFLVGGIILQLFAAVQDLYVQ